MSRRREVGAWIGDICEKGGIAEEGGGAGGGEKKWEGR